jgi:hypothetical protein
MLKTVALNLIIRSWFVSMLQRVYYTDDLRRAKLKLSDKLISQVANKITCKIS